MSTDPRLIAINVGNTRTQIGLFRGGSLDPFERFENDALADLVQRIVELWPLAAESPPAVMAMASVNDVVADRLASAIEDQCSVEVFRVGRDLPVPIGEQLDPETITGVDRLLNAAAAYDSVREACVVVDAGTAVTVDFVDGEGTFQGGAIAPGAQMQLRSLHETTAALPDLEFRMPDGESFGRSTAEAMLIGVYQGIRGLVWRLVEQYAESYGAFPIVIATGGDAPVLFKDDELIDRVVPGLTLIGIAVAARLTLSTDDADVAH